MVSAVLLSGLGPLTKDEHQDASVQAEAGSEVGEAGPASGAFRETLRARPSPSAAALVSTFRVSRLLVAPPAGVARELRRRQRGGALGSRSDRLGVPGNRLHGGVPRLPLANSSGRDAQLRCLRRRRSLDRLSSSLQPHCGRQPLAGGPARLLQEGRAGRLSGAVGCQGR